MNARIGMAGLIACAILIGGSLYAAENGSGDATAQSVRARIELLEIKEDIRQTISLYTLLKDSDGGQPDRKEWANRIFTKDAVLATYNPDDSPRMEIKGRDEILKNAKIPTDAGPLVRKHFLVNTFFDEVTPNRVKTRTTALMITVKLGGGDPEQTLIMTYHDTWVRDGGQWKKSRSEIHYKT